VISAIASSSSTRRIRITVDPACLLQTSLRNLTAFLPYRTRSGEADRFIAGLAAIRAGQGELPVYLLSVVAARFVNRLLQVMTLSMTFLDRAESVVFPFHDFFMPSQYHIVYRQTDKPSFAVLIDICSKFDYYGMSSKKSSIMC
jgi:hypothetical protein